MSSRTRSGFGSSVGIAVIIAVTQFGEVLGLKANVSGAFVNKLSIIGANLNQFNGAAMFLAVLTFLITRYLLKISIYIPAPMLAIGDARTFVDIDCLAFFST